MAIKFISSKVPSERLNMMGIRGENTLELMYAGSSTGAGAQSTPREALKANPVCS